METYQSLYVCAYCCSKYQKRISGPLLDCIDIRIEVPRMDYEKLSGDRRESHLNPFEQESKLRATFSSNAFRKTNPQILFYCLQCGYARRRDVYYRRPGTVYSLKNLKSSHHPSIYSSRIRVESLGNGKGSVYMLTFPITK